MDPYLPRLVGFATLSGQALSLLITLQSSEPELLIIDRHFWLPSSPSHSILTPQSQHDHSVIPHIYFFCDKRHTNSSFAFRFCSAANFETPFTRYILPFPLLVARQRVDISPSKFDFRLITSQTRSYEQVKRVLRRLTIRERSLSG